MSLDPVCDHTQKAVVAAANFAHQGSRSFLHISCKAIDLGLWPGVQSRCTAQSRQLQKPPQYIVVLYSSTVLYCSKALRDVVDSEAARINRLAVYTYTYIKELQDTF